MIREGRTMRARAAMALASALVFLGSVSTATLADNDRHGQTPAAACNPDMNDPKIAGDPDYGVCRGTNPKCYHDWVARGRADPREQGADLHAAPPARATPTSDRAAAGHEPAAHEAYRAHTVQNAIIRWLQAHGVEVDWTEDVTRISEPAIDTRR